MELPRHAQEAVDVLAEVHAVAARDLASDQRAVERLTTAIARPISVVVVLAAVVAWVAVNVALSSPGRAFDPYPFGLLQGIVALSALVMTILIITSERRIGHESERLARLALQMGIVTEQKVAKVLELLERQRREEERPHDPIASEMAQASDPHAALQALDQAHDTHGDLSAS